MEAVTRKARDYPRVTAAIRAMSLGPVDPQDPTLLQLVLDFRRRFKIEPVIDPAEHVSTRWQAMRYADRIVAVFGERDFDHRTLEVTDAYAEPGRIGRIASGAMFLRYKALVDEGKIGRLVFTVLTENAQMLMAVVRETRQLPLSVKFVLEGKRG